MSQISTTRMAPRSLWQGGPEINSIGLGCWAIGGPFFSGAGCAYPTGQALGWGEVDDQTSIRAIHCALDQGITFFDTADAYGTGHSERILGHALKERRSDAVIATKFGNTYDVATNQLTGIDVSPDYMRWACEASLRRLECDVIDLYQLHVGSLPAEQFEGVAEGLERLCEAGLIRRYGWSTDDPTRAAVTADFKNAVAIQHDMNVFQDTPALLEVCQSHDLTSINRCPLAMGFLSGKFTGKSKLAQDDIRATPPDWLVYFEAGGRASAAWLARLEAISEILRSDGRSLVQGALAWIWARSPRTIPIPGFRTEAQVVENAAALDFGPLGDAQMAEIDRLLDR